MVECPLLATYSYTTHRINNWVLLYREFKKQFMQFFTPKRLHVITDDWSWRVTPAGGTRVTLGSEKPTTGDVGSLLSSVIWGWPLGWLTGVSIDMWGWKSMSNN